MWDFFSTSDYTAVLKIGIPVSLRFLLIGGRRGHLAIMDWQNKTLGCEIHVQETVRDVRYSTCMCYQGHLTSDQSYALCDIGDC